MSEQFHNPYHFVPVDTSMTQTVKWENTDENNQFARHDFWHSEGWSGRLICELTTLSPTAVGGQHTENKMLDYEKGIKRSEPTTVHPYRLPDNEVTAKERLKSPAHLPANSLRGMVASIAETISQSSLRVLTKESESPLSVRRSTKIPLKKMGILLREDDGDYLLPLGEGWSYGRYINLNREKMILATDKEKQENKAIETRDCYHFVHNNYPASELGGFLYIRGYHADMPNKQRETLLAFTGELYRDADALIRVQKNCVGDFQNILQEQHRHRKNKFPVLPKGYEEHDDRWIKDKNGEPLPCVLDGDLLYYEEDAALGVVTELSYSQIWRRPVKGKLHEALALSGGENALPWHGGRDSLTPAECLFGVVEDMPCAKRGGARNLASRLRFTDATISNEARFFPQQTLKILGSPKPPSPALYFGAGQEKYISKDKLSLCSADNPQGAIPNGRKVYLPHPDTIGNKNTHYRWNSTTRGGEHMHVRCTPIDINASFDFVIHYDNLKQSELKLLFQSLEPSEAFIHRLGLGKPLGLGHIKIRVKSIETINRVERYTVDGLQQAYTEDTALLEKLRTDSADDELINPNSLATLSTLANPDNIKHPVCYPYSSQPLLDQKTQQQKEPRQQAYEQSKGYRWFVENDRPNNAKDYLQTVSDGVIPPLNSE